MRYILAALLAVAYCASLAYDAGVRPTPRCAEDVVLVGKVEFGNGYWAGFECGPALDDMKL